ncbi:MAG: UDP-N-acetylenolpyruvoylglucosamine reductase, partial [Firmicutes bacterium]|nr:UDP-N-acetylenolpyruvoylglucosamine reductase [Bacillota bacterium]
DIIWLTKEECDFAYRHSTFQSHKDWTILAAKIKLQKGDIQKISDLMDSRRKRRMDSQPLDRPCAGSVFRNPVEIPAWKLIEQMGFRGYSVGGAQVSEKHANFIINANNSATAKDILDLIKLIQRTAKEEHNIELITEVEQLNW